MYSSSVIIKIKTLLRKLKQSALFKDSFWAISGSIAARGLSLLAGVFVARFLGKEIYGEYGTIKNTLIYIAIVSTFGFGYTATKYIADYLLLHPTKIKDMVKKFLMFTIFFSSFLGVILFAFADQIAFFLNAPHLGSAFRISSLVVVVNAINTTQIGLLSGFKLFKEIAKANAYSGIFTFVSSVILTYFYLLNGAILALLISFLFQVYLNRRILKRKMQEYSFFDVLNVEEIKEILRFSMPIALQEGLYTIVNWLTILLLIKFADYGEVGLSSAASIWKSLVIFIPSMLKNVMFSHLSGTGSSNNKLINRLLLINFITTLLPIMVVFIFADWISSFYGDSFNNLKPILYIQVSTSLFICLSEVFCYDLISLGKPWFVFFARFIRDAGVLLLGYCFILLIATEQAYWLSVSAFIMNVVFFIILYLMRLVNGEK